MEMVERPRWDLPKNNYFRGKIGIQPFTNKKKVQKRNLKSTSLAKVMEVIIKEIFKKNDNQKNHALCSNSRPQYQTSFTRRTCKAGCSLQLKRQPPKSPNLYILDLDFFFFLTKCKYCDIRWSLKIQMMLQKQLSNN